MNAKAQTESNPREKIGDNQPPLPALISDVAETQDFALLVTEWLRDRYGSVPKITDDLLAECAALVKDPVTGTLRQIDGSDMKGKVASLIKRIRDEAKKQTGLHEKEKTAYQRGGQATDQFFFGNIDKLSRRAKTNKPGAADVLNDLLTAYDNKLLAEEQAERRRLADIAAREAAAAVKKAAEEAAAAEARRAEAERARKPEHVETKTVAADQQEAAASVAAAEAQAATDRAQAAHIDTLAKAPDIMRSRGDDGTLSTMQTEPYALVIDRTKLDFAKLAPFFTVAEIEKSVRGWAKNTGYTQQMEGAEIGRRAKSVVR